MSDLIYGFTYIAITFLIICKMSVAKEQEDIYGLIYYGFGLITIVVLYYSTPLFKFWE